MSETGHLKTWRHHNGATYRANYRLHNEAGYCLRAKVKCCSVNSGSEKSALVPTALKSTERRPVIGSIAGNKPTALGLRVVLQFGVILVS